MRESVCVAMQVAMAGLFLLFLGLIVTSIPGMLTG